MGMLCRYRVCLGGSENYYFWTPESEIKSVFDGCKFGNSSEIYLGHVVGMGKSKVVDGASFVRDDLESLTLKCKNRDSAVVCMKFLGLSEGFVG